MTMTEALHHDINGERGAGESGRFGAPVHGADRSDMMTLGPQTMSSFRLFPYAEGPWRTLCTSPLKWVGLRR